MLNTNERIFKHKLGLQNLDEELGNVSKICQVMGLSRDTFYRYKSAVGEGGVEVLLDQPVQAQPEQPQQIHPQGTFRSPLSAVNVSQSGGCQHECRFAIGKGTNHPGVSMSMDSISRPDVGCKLPLFINTCMAYGRYSYKDIHYLIIFG